jgi:hypothetical protein
MNFYNIFGEFIKIEKFTENNQQNNQQNEQQEQQDLTDYNVYSHIVLSSVDNKIRITLFPLYFGENGHFNLSTKGDSYVKNFVIKASADSSYINNPAHIGTMLENGKELDRNLFKAFRIYNKKLQMIDNGNNKVNLSFDPETKKVNNSDKPFNLHLFDYSPSGSEVFIFNNEPQGSFYKVNKTRNTFYLTTDLERKQFVKSIQGTTENKNEASIFTFKEIDPNQEVRNETRINIPEEKKDGSGAIRNLDQIHQARSLKVSFQNAHKYNLLELAKNTTGDWEKVKLKFIKDEIRGTVVFVPLKKEEDTQPYQLHVWIKE